MALSTYAELQASIASWLNRQDLTATIPEFIRLAEADIANVLRDRRMQQTVIASADCGNIALPSDWLEAVDVRVVGASRALRFIPLAENNEERTDGYLEPPRFFTLTGSNLLLMPTPPEDEIPQVQMTYFARPAALTDETPSNWILVEEPSLYLYGSLLHAASFLIDDERIPTWERAFSGRVEMLNRRSDEALVSGGPLVRGRRGFG